MESPLHTLHSARHAVFQDVGGKPVPAGYGDFGAEADAVERGAGIMDWSAGGVIGVRGPDAALFLNGVTTNNVKALAKGRAQENLLCANKGKILHAVWIVRTKEDEFLVLTEPGETDAVARHLDSYHVREDLVMGVAGLSRLDVLGPLAPRAVERAGLALPAAGMFAPNLHGGAPVLTLNLPLGALPRFSLLVPPPAAPGVVEALLNDPAARLVGLAAWDEARIWSRVPRFPTDFGPDHLPAEAGLYTHIAFDKGCYVGQEIHARMHYRGHPNRKLVAVTIPEAAAARLNVGGDLYEGPEVAGHLTSLAQRGRNGVRAGIAMIRYPLAAERIALAAVAGGPAEVAVAPVATDLGSARP
jgi:folate-binding protein YgfZ